MIFTSLLKLVESNADAVYTFLCRICDESNFELSLEDARNLDNALEKFRQLPKKDLPHFFELINMFEDLQSNLKELNPKGKYSYFITEEDMPVSYLKGELLILVSDYISLFGRDSVKVPVPCGRLV